MGSSGYIHMNIGESFDCKNDTGSLSKVVLNSVDEKIVIVQVNGRTVSIPLGHFKNRRLGNMPDDVINVVDVEGLRIGADMTKSYMAGSKYSLSLVNLQKDARIWIGPAHTPLSPSGNYAFPVSLYEWNYGENWLPAVPYGWHLGVDMDAELGHPLAAVTDGQVLDIRYFDADKEPEDYWGNGLALLGDDGRVYIYMHWDKLSDGLEEGSRVKAGEEIGVMGRSGFDSMTQIATHLHFEIMVLKNPQAFRFAFELEPSVLSTPNRLLPPETDGFVVNPYPYLVEWYGG